jgi:hypothetical protein
VHGDFTFLCLRSVRGRGEALFKGDTTSRRSSFEVAPGIGGSRSRLYN